MDPMTTVTIPPPASPDDPTAKIEAEPVADDPAPWGYKPDGTPYKVNPERYHKRDAKRRSVKAPSSSKAKAKGSDRRDAVLGLFQIVSLPIAAGAAAGSPAFAADLVTIDAYAEPVADAFDSLAGQNKAVAQALDKLGEVGPYGLVIGALAPLVLQIAVNHGVLPPGTAGTSDPEHLIAEFNRQHGGGDGTPSDV